MLINLTPHPIVIYPYVPASEYEDLEWINKNCKIIPTSEQFIPARLSMVYIGEFHVDDFLIERVEYGQLETYYPNKPDTYYIVSLIVALAVTRKDFLVPYREVRNSTGTVIGCRSLARPS